MAILAEGDWSIHCFLQLLMSLVVLYVDDILLNGNDVGILLAIRIWLSNQFDMKDLGEASYIIGIKIW